ncbi:MAG: response regulator, partial [Spirochaetes bacterium]|nr:response regulator [Spirochaetota bacterium]
MEIVTKQEMKKENKRFRILIVDDEENILKLLSRFLADMGYTTDTTVSGLWTVENVNAREYDLVLLDLRLPDMNGLEVLKEIKKQDSSISVLIMTGYGKVETAVTAMKLGADDYLLKPFKSLDALGIIINRIKEYRELRA